ncbi:MAG TPA: RnfABCDGE type electron transport complex subunit B [Candidatus Polarisedimenticolaceae bacterium]|nr:RnfABCDGE type electron transport complex subunit B [Candidatus Polarisedimenticolaceae bacterium]
MSEVLAAASIMLGLAGFFGVVLSAANRYLRVEEDPRIDQVEEMLPGTNCGACGQPGCRGFAEALIEGRTVPGKCSVSPAAEVARIASFLGVEAGVEERRVARLHCAGGRSSVRRLADYAGIDSCRAAVLVNGGGKACPWGCLGLGDCERVCGFDAIRMTTEDLPRVSVLACTACGDCVEVCPLDLFTLERVSHRVIVQCRSPLGGELARSLCRVACDACGRCALDAQQGVIEMQEGLPRLLDPARADERCTLHCPTGAIRWVVGDQFAENDRV